MNCNCQNNGAQASAISCGCAAARDISASCCGCGCDCNCGCNCNCGCGCNCNCNCGCNLLYRCNCLKRYIAQLTQRINEYSAYLDTNPCDKLAACLVCEAKKELAAVKEYYCSICNCDGKDCICNAPDDNCDCCCCCQ